MLLPPKSHIQSSAGIHRRNDDKVLEGSGRAELKVRPQAGRAGWRPMATAKATDYSGKNAAKKHGQAGQPEPLASAWPVFRGLRQARTERARRSAQRLSAFDGAVQ